MRGTYVWMIMIHGLVLDFGFQIIIRSIFNGDYEIIEWFTSWNFYTFKNGIVLSL